MQKNRFSHHSMLFILSFLLTIFVQNAYAVDVSIAKASQNLMTPLNLFTHTVYNICYVVAISLFIACIAQYRLYRLNPSQAALNRPITLLLLATIVALIPFIAKFSASEAYTHL